MFVHKGIAQFYTNACGASAAVYSVDSGLLVIISRVLFKQSLAPQDYIQYSSSESRWIY